MKMKTRTYVIVSSCKNPDFPQIPAPKVAHEEYYAYL